MTPIQARSDADAAEPAEQVLDQHLLPAVVGAATRKRRHAGDVDQPRRGRRCNASDVAFEALKFYGIACAFDSVEVERTIDQDDGSVCDDLWAPVLREHVGRHMPVEETMCRIAARYCDNPVAGQGMEKLAQGAAEIPCGAEGSPRCGRLAIGPNRRSSRELARPILRCGSAQNGCASGGSTRDHQRNVGRFPAE